MDNTQLYKTLPAAYESVYKACGTRAGNLAAAQKLWDQMKASKDDYKNASMEIKSKSDKRAFKR